MKVFISADIEGTTLTTYWDQTRTLTDAKAKPHCQQMTREVVAACEGAIAAWSCGVPALCIGATPRATGLAKELFSRWEDVVIPFSSLKTSEDLTARFRQFLRMEDKLRRQLDITVPLRRQQALQWQW